MTDTAITIEEIKNSDIVADMEANGLTVAMFIGKFHHPEHAENDWAIELYEINGTKVVATNGGTIWDNGNPDFDQMNAEYGITL